MSVADDFGRFEADPELLRRRLYVTGMEHISATDFKSRLNECPEADLMRTRPPLRRSLLRPYEL